MKILQSDSELDLVHSPVYRAGNDSSIHSSPIQLSNQTTIKTNGKESRKQDETRGDRRFKAIDRQASEDDESSFATASDLDVVQKYLQQTRPDGEYNDEVIATYLSCNGLLDTSNRCLQRLVCQYADPQTVMPDLEKEVASLYVFVVKSKFK